MKNKKGQFYLIAALIIIAIIASLILNLNFAKITPEPLEFKELSENFEQEALQIIDQGVFNRDSLDTIQENLEAFARKYTEYTSQKAPKTGFLYVFGNNKDISVVNYLLEGAEVTTKGENSTTLAGGNALTLHRLTFKVGEEKFIRDLEIKAKEFEGINFASGEGSLVHLNVGGIPYNIAITKDISFKALTIECKKQEGKEIEECFVELSK